MQCTKLGTTFPMIKTTSYRPALGLAALKSRENYLGLTSCYPDEPDDTQSRISASCSEQRERNSLMLMRKHCIEQRGAASLKHSLDPKLCMQDAARPTGPADRAVGTTRDELGQTCYWVRRVPVPIHGRGPCDSWSDSKWFTQHRITEWFRWEKITESNCKPSTLVHH